MAKRPLALSAAYQQVGIVMTGTCGTAVLPVD
jgi:hypothetical protein